MEQSKDGLWCKLGAGGMIKKGRGSVGFGVAGACVSEQEVIGRLDIVDGCEEG